MNKSFSVVVALVCGTLATVVASRWLSAKDDGPGLAMSDIFVAVAAIDVGDEITPEKIKLEQWPADRVPAGSTGDLAQLEGKFAKQRFYEGEAIMPVKLMDDNWTEVPKSYRVVAMNASDSGISNLIQPGDRVDVSAFFEKSDLIPQSTTQTVLRGVRVYALDGDTQRRTGNERPKNLRNIQLLIHESETRAWELANRIGEISLLVSSDADRNDDDNAASEEFTAWLSDLQDKRDAAAQEKSSFEKFRATPPPAATQKATVTAEPKKPEGYKMIKHTGGRVVEYWITPGELPKLIGEVGESDDSATDAAGDTRTPATDGYGSGPGEASSAGIEESQYSYLNGSDSPFFRSDDNR